MENIKQESLEMFMLKRKILKELEEMDENEDFIMQIGLAGKDTAKVMDTVGGVMYVEYKNGEVRECQK